MTGFRTPCAYGCATATSSVYVQRAKQRNHMYLGPSIFRCAVTVGRTGAKPRPGAVQGTGDDFFELEASSLHLVQIAAKSNQVYRIELPVPYLFDEPTVARRSPFPLRVPLLCCASLQDAGPHRHGVSAGGPRIHNVVAARQQRRFR